MTPRHAAALASDDGPIFSTVAKLVDALKRSIPEGTRNAELKNEALHVDRVRLLRRNSSSWVGVSLRPSILGGAALLSA
jgi:hypothetical protein